MAVIYEYPSSDADRPAEGGLDRRLDLLGILAKQRLQVNVDDIPEVAKLRPVRTTKLNGLRLGQTVGNVEETFMGEDKSTHPLGSHSRSTCQLRPWACLQARTPAVGATSPRMLYFCELSITRRHPA
jgi:hypothetical protein